MIPKFTKNDLYIAMGAVAGIIAYKRFVRPTVAGVL